MGNHFLLALLITAFYTASAQHHHREYPTDPTACSALVRSSCNKTTYPTLCYSSLCRFSDAVQESTKLLADVALNITLATTRSAARMTSSLVNHSGKRARMTHEEAGALQDCLEVLGDSVEELKGSVSEMKQVEGPGLGFHMSNVQTWVSAALTDDSTCTDGFDGKSIDGKLKEVVRGRVVTVARLTSNALALINSYANSVHGLLP